MSLIRMRNFLVALMLCVQLDWQLKSPSGSMKFVAKTASHSIQEMCLDSVVSSLWICLNMNMLSEFQVRTATVKPIYYHFICVQRWSSCSCCNFQRWMLFEFKSWPKWNQNCQTCSELYSFSNSIWSRCSSSTQQKKLAAHQKPFHYDEKYK